MVHKESRTTELKQKWRDDHFLKKQGKHWDVVPLSGIKVPDLSNSALQSFRTLAAAGQRTDSDILKEEFSQLLEKLHLTEGGYLKRLAALLFLEDPERFITGAYVKIGYFKTDDELVYQDEIHGHLFHQIEQTIDLLTTKYLKAAISYKGIQRQETLPYPEAALREAVINAIAHKNYSSGTQGNVNAKFRFDEMGFQLILSRKTSEKTSEKIGTWQYGVIQYEFL